MFCTNFNSGDHFETNPLSFGQSFLTPFDGIMVSNGNRLKSFCLCISHDLRWAKHPVRGGCMKVEIHISHRHSLNPVLERGNGNEYLPAAGRTVSHKKDVDLNFIIDALPKVNSLIPLLMAFPQNQVSRRYARYRAQLSTRSLFPSHISKEVFQTQVNLLSPNLKTPSCGRG